MHQVIKPTQHQNRATFTRFFLGLSLSAGFGFTTMVSVEDLRAQHCDQCAAHGHPMSAPSCGCETPEAPRSMPRTRECNSCKPVCGPSFAEKFLKKLDEAGDRFEASLRKTKTGQCDACLQQSHHQSPCESGYSLTPVHPYSNPHSQLPAATGVIGDQYPKSYQSSPTNLPLPPKVQPLDATADKPLPVRNPFEPRLPVPPQLITETPPVPLKRSELQKPVSRIPAEESDLGSKVLGPSSSNSNSPAPPLLKKQEPTIPAVPPAAIPTLPDVLVDPFKDDPTAIRDAQAPQSIQLTSARRTKVSGLRLRAPHISSSSMDMDAPEPLTQDQRKTLGSDVTTQPSSHPSKIASDVIPIAYQIALPVRVSPRSMKPAPTEDDAPIVSRIAVPRKR